LPIAIVEPPPPPRLSSDPADRPAPSIFAAPVVAPDGVAPEPPVEPRDAPSSTIPGVDGGVPGSFGLTFDQLPPPPPPPPTPAPHVPVRLSDGMRAPRKVANVDPVYPRVAQIAHVEGVVILEATIDARGRVMDVRVLRSVPLLDEAAIEAVRQWIYTPTLLNGVPVPIVMTVTVNFRLRD
jgi:protein TonB